MMTDVSAIALTTGRIEQHLATDLIVSQAIQRLSEKKQYSGGALIPGGEWVNS